MFVILQYMDYVCDMHDLAKYLPPPLMKGGGFKASYWAVRKKCFNEDVIRVVTKDRLPTSMQDEL